MRNGLDLGGWRRKKSAGEAFTTPSGLVVKLTRVSLLDLAEAGSIPAPLVGMVNKIIDTRTHALSVDDVPEYAGAINLLVTAALIDPPVAEEADAQHLEISELPMKDRLAIFNWANVGESLVPFRFEDGEPETA
jgi:hypothetical protein